MLLFKRKRGETFVIQPRQFLQNLNAAGCCGEQYFRTPIRIHILGVRSGVVNVGIEADSNLLVLREELLSEKQGADASEAD